MPRPRIVSDEEILRATSDAIGRVGPHRLTLAAIAEQAGISPSALVQRFGSKRELLLALAREAPVSLDHRIEEARCADGSPLDALVEMLVEESAGFAETPEAAANHLAFLQIDLDDPAFRRHAVSHSRRMQAGIRELLDDAVRGGELQAGDMDRLAKSVLVAYSGSLITWAIRRERPLAEALRRDVGAVLAPHLTR